MADGPSVDVMVASGVHDDSAVATRTYNERAVVGLSKRCGPSDHPPRAAAVRLCLDNPAAKSSSHGEQGGEAGAMDTCGAAHTLDSMPAHTTAHATASAMPAHVLHESQPAEQTPPFDLLPSQHKRTRADMDTSTNTHYSPHTYHCMHTDGTVTQTPAGIVICVHSLGQHSHIAMASHAHRYGMAYDVDEY